ncbi:MAG: stage V sporulation protein AC [Clostridia bacterium]
MQIYTKKEYKKLVEKKSPNSPLFKNCSFAFLFGGTICLVGQIIFHYYMVFGMSIADARLAVSITLIFSAAVLTAFGVYDKIAKHAGAGTLVPITGFANSMVSPAMEFRSEGMITGLGVKLFVVSGPVLVFGISSSVLYGIIYYFIELWS